LHHLLHGTADSEALLGKRHRRVTGLLLVGGKHADEAVSHADGPLARTDFARVRQEDFEPGASS
jgi:hypothetical protein